MAKFRASKALASASFLLALGNPLPAWSAPAERAQAARELESIAQDLNALDRWLNDADKRRAELQSQLKNRDEQVANLSTAVRSNQIALQESEQTLKALEAEANALQVKRTAQAGQIRDNVYAAYRLSKQDVIKTLLNQDSPQEFERMLRYHQLFSDARIKVFNEYQSLLASLVDKQQEISAEQDRLRSREKALAKEQTRLRLSRDQRLDLIQRLNANVKDKTAERERLLRDRRRLEQLIAELKRRETEVDGRAFAQRKGSLPWPAAGDLSHRYGSARAEGTLKWEGIVIGAKQGTEVKAIYRGRVIFSDWLRGFGLLTIIDHGSGFMTLYGHTDDLRKSVGDWVESGEVVAQAGQSGGQELDGLYFEVRQKGKTQNPLGWLSKR